MAFEGSGKKDIPPFASSIAVKKNVKLQLLNRYRGRIYDYTLNGTTLCSKTIFYPFRHYSYE